MSRARNIKPGIMENDTLAECDFSTRLLFIYLWMLADREGRLEDKPRKIRAQAFPYDDGIDVDAMLNQLSVRGFVCRYEVEGIQYIQIVNFVLHQSPHVKEKASTIPAPDKHQTSTRQAPDKHDKCTSVAPPDSLIVDSGYRIPDSLNPDKPLPAVRAKTKNFDADDFEKFWLAYPKKKSKGQAEKTWAKINPNSELVEKILSALESAKRSQDWIKDSGMFIPHPSTWLNAKGWEDEIFEIRAGPHVRHPENIEMAKRFLARGEHDQE